MSDETVHPLVFFWIAFYRDGTCLPQFDIETGRGNDFKDIDQTKLDKFGLFPFSGEFSIKVNISAGKTIARGLEILPYFIMQLKDDKRLISWRRNYIHTFTYQHCDKCGYEWQWIPDRKDGEKTDIGLLIHPKHVVQEWLGKFYPLAQCPKCGSFDAVVCPDCKTLIAEMKTKEPDDGNHIFKCRKCNKEFPRCIRMFDGTLRRAVYLLGYQTTVDGKNYKQIMFINEDGTFELSEDFNYK
jgi:hypothetical protein